MLTIQGLENLSFGQEKKEEKQVTREEVLRKIEELKAQLAEVKGDSAVEETRQEVKQMTVDKSVPKNHRTGKVDAGRKYKLLTKKMSMTGNVPQQQADIADLLASRMDVGKEYTEAEVFNFLIDGAGDYKSLYGSKQDPTYLFRYYRGIKKDKYLGFIARNFLVMIG